MSEHPITLQAWDGTDETLQDYILTVLSSAAIRARVFIAVAHTTRVRIEARQP